MTTETLQKAKDLQKQIEDLKKHKEEFEEKEYKEERFNVEKWDLCFTRHDYNRRVFRPELLTIDKKTLHALYIAKIDEEIKRLESELAAL